MGAISRPRVTVRYARAQLHEVVPDHVHIRIVSRPTAQILLHRRHQLVPHAWSRRKELAERVGEVPVDIGGRVRAQTRDLVGHGHEA